MVEIKKTEFGFSFLVYFKPCPIKAKVDAPLSRVIGYPFVST